MNLSVIGIRIGREKDLIIGYRYRLKFFISCIPTLNIYPHLRPPNCLLMNFLAFAARQLVNECVNIYMSLHISITSI